MSKTEIRNLIIGLGMLVLACTPKPVAINYGSDQCAYCKMNIVDPKFGAEIVTKKGRTYKFDAIECMVRYDAEQDTDMHAYLVNTISQPGTLVPAESCEFLISSRIPSPMGANLSAHLDHHTIPNLEGDQKLFAWDELPQALIQ